MINNFDVVNTYLTDSEMGEGGGGGGGSRIQVVGGGMVLNPTFNNISVISCLSVLLMT